MATLRVNRGFMFHYPGDGKERAAKVYTFVKGVHEDVPAEVVEHRWIKEDLADGFIDEVVADEVDDEPEEKGKKKK
jgi:hypothetical protein